MRHAKLKECRKYTGSAKYFYGILNVSLLFVVNDSCLNIATKTTTRNLNGTVNGFRFLVRLWIKIIYDWQKFIEFYCRRLEVPENGFQVRNMSATINVEWPTPISHHLMSVFRFQVCCCRTITCDAAKAKRNHQPRMRKELFTPMQRQKDGKTDANLLFSNVKILLLKL